MATPNTFYRSLLVAGLAASLVSACGTNASAPDEPDAITIDDGGETDSGSVDTDLPDLGGEDTAPQDVTEDVGTEDAAQDVQEDPTPIDVGPPPSCEDSFDCNDGLECTNDSCVDGFCEWSLDADACLINNVCRAAGDPSSSDPCQQCVPSADPFAWSGAEEGAPCDSGDACTVESTCDADGACVGELITCEDGNSCTENLCDPELGCVFEALDNGTDCDDGNACTSGDVCDAGVCTGEVVTCDDDNPCTDDLCNDDGTCSNEPNTDPCDDGDACTDGDTCSDGVCTPAGDTNCDDGNACTIDICDEFAGCSYLPNLNPCCTGTVSICDDGDPCTTDLCDPDTAECAYELNSARCDDGDACTDGDTCTEGTCLGDDVDCEDDNPCTAAFCDEDDGCGFDMLSDVPCDDGVACTIDDMCMAGVCVPGRSECVCEPTFGEAAVKVTGLRIGAGGNPGEALDLDSDPSTCSPATDCSDGRHNALTVIATFVNDSLSEAIADGSLVVVLDIDSLSLNPFEVTLYQGDLDPDNADCDPVAEVCDYLVSPSTLDPDTCSPLVSLAATRSGDRVTAGGPGTVISLDVPLGDGVLSLTLYNVRLEGTLVTDGGEVTSFDGILGGAVLKSDLLTALEALPPDTLPLPAESIAGLLNTLVEDDIDIDGDGEGDAASIGLPVSGIGGNITGLSD